MRLIVAVLIMMSASLCALGKEKPFPSQILEAKTIAVVAHYGSMPSNFDAAKGSKFKSDAEDVLRESGRFTLVESPDKSDLVLLLVSGYSTGRLGFNEHIATGTVFLGSGQPGWSTIPLWIAEKMQSMRTSSAAAVTKMFLNEVKKAEQHAANLPAGTNQQKTPDESRSQDMQKEKNTSPSEEPEAGLLPREIMQAKKVMVVSRVDAGTGPEGVEKSVEKEIKKWGRFSLVNNTADADLVILCFVFTESSDDSFFVFENILIFKGGEKNPDWNAMPLWTAVQALAPFRPPPGAQMIRQLKKQVERQEALPAPLHPGPGSTLRYSLS